ncbi:MAG: hypothetical protein ACRCYX_14300 [Dermatophilaceae bacterium]
MSTVQAARADADLPHPIQHLAGVEPLLGRRWLSRRDRRRFVIRDRRRFVIRDRRRFVIRDRRRFVIRDRLRFVIRDRRHAEDGVDAVLAERPVSVERGEHELTDELDLVLQLLVAQRRIPMHWLTVGRVRRPGEQTRRK